MRTSAEVIEVAESREARRDKVRFTTDVGQQVEALIGQGDRSSGEDLKAGDTIPIVYDPHDPSDDVRDARAPENHEVGYLLLGMTVTAALVVVVGPWTLVRARRRRVPG